ncbi:MAG: TIM barrel protein [Methanoregula sp.]
MQIGMLPGSYAAALDRFRLLQKQFSFLSAELQLEPSLYNAHFPPPDKEVPDVEILGVHLPFMDLDPFSTIAERRHNSRQVLSGSIQNAADIDADYVVFHARAPGPVNRGEEWAPLVSELAEKSGESGMKFCLENADDLYDIAKIHEILHELPEVNLCLDIGHLYEHTFNLVTRYLPLSHDRRLARELENLYEHIACIHIHNHDGFYAHRTLEAGKIDFSPLRKYRSMEIPLILESDYRDVPADTLSHDIRYLRDMIA